VSLATVRDGKIQEWTEYSDPAPFERAQAALAGMRAAVGDEIAGRRAAG
jgi:hypothetical protein